MEKIICAKCGKVNDEGNKHCSKCKASLPVPPKEAKPSIRNTETSLSHTATTADLKHKAEVFTSTASIDQKACCCPKMGLMGKIVIFILGIAVIGGLLYYNRNEDLFAKTKAYLRYCEGSTVSVVVPKDNYIPFCKDKNEAKLFYHSFKIGDEYEIDDMLKDKRMLYLDYNAKLLILRKVRSYAQVRVLDGMLKGMAGWVYLVEVSQFDKNNTI